jgi:hypothetical protein
MFMPAFALSLGCLDSLRFKIGFPGKDLNTHVFLFVFMFWLRSEQASGHLRLLNTDIPNASSLLVEKHRT